MFKNITNIYKFPFLFLPYGLSFIYDDPVTVYFICWLGSIYIILMSISGFIIPLPKDLPKDEQYFRPLFLTQILFAGYGFITSIFFFADKMGYTYLYYNPTLESSSSDLMFYANCQRLYNLGHACYTSGLLLFMIYKPSKYVVKVKNKSLFLLLFSSGIYMVGFISWYTPGLNQLGSKLEVLAYTASVLSFGAALSSKNRLMIRLNLVLLFLNLVSSFTSGSKEDSLTILILLFLVLYPLYKRSILIIAPIVLYLWLTIIPVLTNTYRSFFWFEGKSSIESFELANEIMNSQTDEERTDASWQLFVNRFSEIGMFEIFVKNIPDLRPYYEWELVNNSIESLIPRFLWPDKPETEYVAMERIYEFGIVERGMGTSAKSHYFADSYMSFGVPGIVFFLFLLGALASMASQLAEKWLGGYYWGSMIMFTGLFKILWVATSFEFMFNAILYSIVLLYIFHVIGRLTNIIVLKNEGGIIN